jgi:hypothetical protein
MTEGPFEPYPEDDTPQDDGQDDLTPDLPDEVADGSE